ncbi:MAG: hypothetical protein CL398_10945 [Acidiferrobacteraceae bacterium]|nr:hypothetical protein [Acidiferrobacteraceae bacterium]
MDWKPIKYPIGDLKLESGEVIQDCQISACIHGEPSQALNNVVLVAASLGGNHRRLDFLIGPDRALDTNRYCVIATDALGNGLSSSPSNSTLQPGHTFPKFSIRDMVASQSQLLDLLSISRLFCVIGASMGGMQALQWAVSHRNRMDCIVALTPMAQTPAWSQAITLISRQLLGAHDMWQDERTSTEAWRCWIALLDVIAGSTPATISKRLRTNELQELLETEVKSLIANPPDPLDWIWQTLAYDQYNLGTTPGVEGGTTAALNSISTPTLILAAPGDLMNPESEAMWAAEHIPGSTYCEIPSEKGHQAATSIGATEVNFMNRRIATFLDEHFAS